MEREHCQKEAEFRKNVMMAKGKQTRCRKMKKDCGEGCKYKCFENVSEEIRKKYLICSWVLEMLPDNINFDFKTKI